MAHQYEEIRDMESSNDNNGYTGIFQLLFNLERKKVNRLINRGRHSPNIMYN